MSLFSSRELWLAWCRRCQKGSIYGEVYHQSGWPFCSCGRRFEWVPPEKNGEGVLRVWDTEVTA